MRDGRGTEVWEALLEGVVSMSDAQVPNIPPLNEWQKRTLINQDALIEAQKETMNSIETLSGHVERVADALEGMLDILIRLEIKL